MIKLIVTDLDGTFLDDEKNIHPTFKDTLANLTQKGIKFAVASGRSYMGIHELFKDYEDIYFICDNGAFIQHNGETIDIHSFSRNGFENIIEYLYSQGIYNVMICGKKGTYYKRANDEFNYRMDNMYNEMIEVDNLLEINDEFFKISVFDINNVQDNIYKPLTDFFNEELSIHISAKVWVDIMVAGINKGSAIKDLQQELNITYEQTMAFGDFHNDIPMLENAKYSFAMENAHQEVKDKANFIAKSNNQNGVLGAIKEYALNL